MTIGAKGEQIQQKHDQIGFIPRPSPRTGTPWFGSRPSRRCCRSCRTAAPAPGCWPGRCSSRRGSRTPPAGNQPQPKNPTRQAKTPGPPPTTARGFYSARLGPVRRSPRRRRGGRRCGAAPAAVRPWPAKTLAGRTSARGRDDGASSREARAARGRAGRRRLGFAGVWGSSRRVGL